VVGEQVHRSTILSQGNDDINTGHGQWMPVTNTREASGRSWWRAARDERGDVIT
jgi:hypothetical protein